MVHGRGRCRLDAKLAPIVEASSKVVGLALLEVSQQCSNTLLEGPIIMCFTLPSIHTVHSFVSAHKTQNDLADRCLVFIAHSSGNLLNMPNTISLSLNNWVLHNMDVRFYSKSAVPYLFYNAVNNYSIC